MNSRYNFLKVFDVPSIVLFPLLPACAQKSNQLTIEIGNNFTNFYLFASLLVSKHKFKAVG